MKKLTALCLSLLVGASAFAGVNPAAQKASADFTRVNVGEAKTVNKIAQPTRAKSNKIPGLAETGTTAMLKGTLAKRAMAKANVETDKIYGGLCYPAYGLYQISHDGTMTQLCQDLFKANSLNISCMGVKDGKLKVLSTLEFWGSILGAYYSVVDLETGTVESNESVIGMFNEGFVQIGAYVPEEDAFYGIANAGWVRFDCESMSAETLDADYLTNNPSIPFSTTTFNGDEEYIAAINARTGTLYKVDYETGEYEELGVAADAAGQYIGGLGYDMSSGNYIYNPNTDSESYLVTIDPTTYAVSVIKEFTENEEFSAFYVDESKPVDPEGPDAAKMVASSFELGATTGTVTFRLPTELNNGTSCAGDELTYKLYINGVEYRSGSAKGGEEIVFSVNEAAGLTNGMAQFNMVCYNGEHMGRDGKAQLYVGKDTPVAPANVTLTPTKITWDAVPGGPTAGVHAGYVNADAVRYNVYLNGKVLVEGLTETECATNLPANAELALYNAEVYAVFDGMVSKPGVSNKLTFGTAFQVPVDFLPTDDEAELFDVVNANGDNKTWVWQSEAGSWVYSYNSLNAADDWLFLPPVNITDVQNYYKFALNVWGQSASIAEKFEVYVGKDVTPAAMTTQVIAPTVVEWDEDNVKNIEGLFNVTEAGKYYIGIHAISDRDKYYLYANNFSVTKTTVAAEGPAAITDVKATAGKEGALEATIEFKMPTTTNNGKTLDATKDVTCTLESLVDLKTVTGKPGSAQKVTMLTVQGMNDITAQTSKEGVMGMISTIQIFTGIAPLSVVENLHFEMGEDNLSGVLKWEAPTESTMEGGYIKQTGIKYYLCQPQQTIFGTSWSIAGEIGTDVFEFPFSIAAQPQNTLQLGIICENEAGMADYLTSAAVSAGTPWDVPAYESWMNGTQNAINYQSVLIKSPLYDGTDSSKKVSWSFKNNLSGDMDTEGAYAFTGTCTGEAYGEVTLPAFSTLGQNKVAFIPEVFVGGCKNIKIYAESWDVASEELLDLDAVIGMETNEYQAVQINLPAKFQNKSWVRIMIRPYFEAGKGTFVLKNYKFRNMVNHDLKAVISGTKKATVGVPATYAVDVENLGLMATDFTGGTFKAAAADGTVIAEKTITANTEVAVDGSATSETFEFTPTIEQVGDVTVSFTLAGNDDNSANNTTEMTVAVVKGKAVVVDDLRGEAVADGKVQLDWTEVQVQSGFESFEDMTPFELSGTNIGQFTQVKNDEVGVYSWQGNDALKALLANVQYKSGFNVYNGPALDDAFGESGMWPATDGEQFLIAFCPGQQEDGTTPDADDWLISPAVKGGSTFSFDIRPLINQYGKEKIEICYSTTDGVDVKDFKVLKTVEVGSDDPEAEAEWENITETLPENAKRFAIHYVSHDIFGICIDKIEWTPASGGLSVTMYEVYRQAEGEEAFVKVGEATANSFIDETANTSVTNKYYVVPVLSDKTKGLKSNVASVAPYTSGVIDLLSSQAIVADKGTIVIRGFEGEKVVVTTADGKVVASGVAKAENLVKVEAGVYVVKAGKRTAKLIVR